MILSLISHGDCPEDAQFVADLIKERFGYENFMIGYIGATIGAHSGPGTVALFYMGTTVNLCISHMFYTLYISCDPKRGM